MTSEVITIITISVITLFAVGLIHYRFREAHFKVWVENFEENLGSEVSDVDKDLILRELFTEDISIKDAVAHYMEVKFIQKEKLSEKSN
jgi:hypothetical protein